ncbi:MAG: HNH endonuclease, partial [Limisphaerales bacterium]
ATLELSQASDLPNIQSSLKQLIGEYDDIIAELQESLGKDCNSELLNIIQEARLDATSKRTEIQIRLGQHRFRRMVLQHWQNCCAVTGANILINASHIKPWRHASNFDRINPYNGLALSPIYDRAFDLGYISFSDDGLILASPTFREQLLRLGINLCVQIAGLTEDHCPYLEYHRKYVFRGCDKLA